MWKGAITRLAMLASLLGVLTTNTDAVNDAQLATRVARFQQTLADNGYQWEEGTVLLWDFNRLYCEGKLDSAYYPNAKAPYFTAVWPETNSPNFTLGADEAMVAIGLTPPPVAYFSFNVHMSFRYIESRGTTGLIWAPVGDPINRLTIHTTGPTPFNQPVVFIGAGHRGMESAMRAALHTAGLPEAMINTQVIAPAMFRLGHNPKADRFALAIRTAQVEKGYEQALLEYQTNVPIRIFRIWPKKSLAADPLPMPPLRLRGTSLTELDLNPTLQMLRQQIIARYPGYKAEDLDIDVVWADNYPGLQRELVVIPGVTDGVMGGTSDAAYLGTKMTPLPQGSFMVAYGAHHRATGKATYASMTLYADTKALASLATVQSPDLQGSAADYIPGDANEPLFYSWKVARNCGSEQHCIQIPDPPCSIIDTNTVRLVFRAYMEPATKAGPIYTELLYDRVLLFTPK